MPHLHNGESSAGTLRQSSIPGEQFAFREALIAGRAPAGQTNAAWRALRAQHLSDAYGIDRGECERDLLQQEERLAGFREHDWDRPLSSGNLGKVSFAITEAVAAVLRDEEDFVTLNGIDQWLGGAHLSESKPLWRWDELNQRRVQLAYSSRPAC
jgi:hypothetical protein